MTVVRIWKALCCTPNQNALNDPVCDADLCGGNESQCNDPDSNDQPFGKRSISEITHHLE
jgi:chitinase